jgi:diguanylate cyclase (GGDEF)-like protein
MYEKNSAKESNPLTGLPGNPIIRRVLSDIVTQKIDSCVLYVDINEFKVYNDVYGFKKGDFMIKYLADMLTEVVKKMYPYTSFIGHVGGDDFIVVLTGEVSGYHQVSKTIIEHFESGKELFFSKKHLEAGSINAEDRFGVFRNLSLTSLSVAGIYGALNQFTSGDQLSEALAKVKKDVKRAGRSHYKIETAFEVVLTAG